jgi:arginase
MGSVHVIGVPLDLGGNRRGVDMGPSAFRIAGLAERLTGLGVQVVDDGDLVTPIPEIKAAGDPRKKYIREISKICDKLYKTSLSVLHSGGLPLVLGGDHSLAAGSVAATADFVRRDEKPLGLLWVDAHGDRNTPSSSGSGNVHGMPLAAALGRAGPGFESASWTLPALEHERLAVIGARALDPGERALIGELGLAVHTMSELDRRGIEAVVGEALERAEGAPFTHISLDLDGLDPEVAPGVGTAVRGGLTYREAHLAMEMVAASGLLCCLEIVEVNPILDRENVTAELAVELAMSAFGATTL